MSNIDAIRITAQDLMQQPGILEERLSRIPEQDPSRDVFKRHAGDLLAMPGAQYVGWFGRTPGQLTVSFTDAGHKALADNVLRDSVAGTTFVLTSDSRPDPAPPVDDRQPGQRLPKTPFWESVPDMSRAISAMRGVHDVRWFDGRVSFRTTAKEHAERLREIVNPAIGRYDVHFDASRSPAGRP